MDKENFSFLNYLEKLLEDRNYQEIFIILNYCEYKKLPPPILKIMAIASYRLKKFKVCITLCSYLVSIGYSKDYFIYEIWAESAYQKNELNISLAMYKKALVLRESLKQASFRYLFLNYRLTGDIDWGVLLRLEKDAVDPKININYLRPIAYLQFKAGLLEKSYSNLKLILERSTNVYYPDLLTMIAIIDKLMAQTVKGQAKKILEIELALYKRKQQEKLVEYKFVSEGHKTLFITLAPGSGFALQKYRYDADRLFVLDGTGTYYVLSHKDIANYVVSLVKQHKYEKISIAGSSKGATGVILLLNQLQKLLSLSIEIRAVSCSPQIKLWPFNTNLRIPSYRILSEYISCNPILEKAFEEMNKDMNFHFQKNINLTIFYGARFKMDKLEASFIKKKSTNVHIMELDYSGHVTSIPLTIPEGKSMEDLRRTYANLPVDPDFAELGGGQLVDIVDEIFEIYSNPEMRLHKFLC